METKFITEENRIYANDVAGNLIAEITFPDEGLGVVNINHTFVDDSLRGQGIAGTLVTLAYDKIKSQGKTAKLTCPYAVQWFEKHPDKQDIVAGA
jgi:predicted GNAT family acetyltransferase